MLIRGDGANSCIADKQWPGRTSRKQDGKEVSLLFDFTDEFNSGFHRKALERRKRYANEGWEQISLAKLLELSD